MVLVLVCGDVFGGLLFRLFFFFFFFKQKTAYEMRISDWSSDVCSSDLRFPAVAEQAARTHDQRVGVRFLLQLDLVLFGIAGTFRHLRFGVEADRKSVV